MKIKTIWNYFFKKVRLDIFEWIPKDFFDHVKSMRESGLIDDDEFYKHCRYSIGSHPASAEPISMASFVISERKLNKIIKAEKKKEPEIDIAMEHAAFFLFKIIIPDRNLIYSFQNQIPHLISKGYV